MNKKVLTTYDISRSLSVDIVTVQNWIKAGRLKAYKTPGGHRRIKYSDYIKFARKHKFPLSADEEKTAFLIVDDNDSVRNTIKKVIQKKFPKAELFEAPNGFRAGRILAAEEIKCLLLDLKMPGMGGYEVMKEIREIPELGSPKIIVVTGLDHPDLEEKVKNYGAAKLVRKPFNIKELTEAICGVAAE